jgi:hypothetical protein
MYSKLMKETCLNHANAAFYVLPVIVATHDTMPDFSLPSHHICLLHVTSTSSPVQEHFSSCYRICMPRTVHEINCVLDSHVTPNLQ